MTTAKPVLYSARSLNAGWDTESATGPTVNMESKPYPLQSNSESATGPTFNMESKPYPLQNNPHEINLILWPNENEPGLNRSRHTGLP